MAQKSNGLKLGVSLMNVVAIIIVVGLVGVGGHFLGRYNEKHTQVTPAVASVQTFTYEGVDGKTALDLLKEKADAQVQESSIGSFVTSINGTENTSEQFWMFYVNGELAPMGADQYQTKNGDQIEWRFESIQ